MRSIPNNQKIRQILESYASRPPKLVVFDPANQWRDIQSALPAFTLPVGEEKRIAFLEGGVLIAVRLVKGPLPECAGLLCLVPEGGFTGDQALAIQERMAREAGQAALFVVALADDEELQCLPGDRSEVGYKALRSEVRTHFESDLFIVPRASFGELAGDVRKAVERMTLAGNKILGWSAVQRTLERLSAERLSVTPRGALSFAQAIGLLNRSARAGVDLQGIQTARAEQRKASQDRDKVVGAWHDLVQSGIDRCARVRMKCRNLGEMAEELVEGVTDEVATIRRRLALDWTHVPSSDLEAWRDDALKSLRTSDVVLPIVGVFSSGKTTLLNRVLGRTEKGRHRLRTSNTHNTALLSRFHSKDPKQMNRVEFTWREELGSLRLVDYSRSMDARDDDNGLGTAQILDLTRKEPIGLLTVRPRAISSILRFIQEGTLSQVTCRVLWRVPPEEGLLGKGLALIQEKASDFAPDMLRLKGPFDVDRQTIKQPSKDFDELLAALARMTTESEAEQQLIRIPSWAKQRAPVRVEINGRVTGPKCRVELHNLETEEDWDWFQGTVPPEDDRARRSPGFAESMEVEYLVAQADVFLDNPLFELVSLVDTPGLNSVTENHDRITEDFIRRGQAFLMMAKLGEAAAQKDSERLLSMMAQALRDNGIRDHEADHVFLVLNWFRAQVGARTPSDAAARVKEFESLASRFLGARDLRLYVVELSPAALARPMEEELLGRPSMKRLIRDLKSFIADRGLADRFTALHSRLKGAWEGPLKAIEREADSLEATEDDAQTAAKIRRVIADYAADGKVRKELKASVREAAKEMEDIVDNLITRLEQIEEKDEFVEFRSQAKSLMGQYNRCRGRLAKEIAEELTSTLRSPLHGLVDNLPMIAPQWDAVNDVPALSASAFESSISTVISEWMGAISRFLRRFAHPLTSYGEARREELLGGYFPREQRHRIVKALKEVVIRYETEIETAVHRTREGLERRLQEVERGESERQERLAALRAQHQKIGAFEPHVKWMLKALSKK